MKQRASANHCFFALSMQCVTFSLSSSPRKLPNTTKEHLIRTTPYVGYTHVKINMLPLHSSTFVGSWKEIPGTIIIMYSFNT